MPGNIPQHSIIRIMGTPKRYPKFWEPPFVSSVIPVVFPCCVLLIGIMEKKMETTMSALGFRGCLKLGVPFWGSP